MTQLVRGSRPGTCAETMIASEPLPHFVDDLLDYLHETHPTHATLDGVHTHDDLLEDASRNGIESEAHALSGYLRRLDEIDLEALTRVERLEHRMLTSHLQGRMFELEAVRTWERNPQFYSDHNTYLFCPLLVQFGLAGRPGPG